MSQVISSAAEQTVFPRHSANIQLTLTERITVTHADSSPSKRARERDQWVVKIAEVLATVSNVLSTEDQNLT